MHRSFSSLIRWRANCEPNHEEFTLYTQPVVGRDPQSSCHFCGLYLCILLTQLNARIDALQKSRGDHHEPDCPLLQESFTRVFSYVTSQWGYVNIIKHRYTHHLQLTRELTDAHNLAGTLQTSLREEIENVQTIQASLDRETNARISLNEEFEALQKSFVKQTAELTAALAKVAILDKILASQEVFTAEINEIDTQLRTTNLVGVKTEQGSVQHRVLTGDVTWDYPQQNKIIKYPRQQERFLI